MPCYQSLPSYLKDTNYQNPLDATNSAFHRAHNTDLSVPEWFLNHPANHNSVFQWMTGQRVGQRIWLDVFPFESELFFRLSQPTTPVFVDVGGATGHQCAALVSKFPQLKGRVILQDLPEVLQRAVPIEGVELMPHDFWTPQPVKGNLPSMNMLLLSTC